MDTFSEMNGGISWHCTKNVCSRNYQLLLEIREENKCEVTFEGELAQLFLLLLRNLAMCCSVGWKISVLLANLTENKDYVVEQDGRNSTVPTCTDKRYLNTRIEPGAIIRDQVTIEDNAVTWWWVLSSQHWLLEIGAELWLIWRYPWWPCNS